MGQYLGIDIGGTTIKSGLVDDTGKVSARYTIETPRNAGNEQLLNAITQTLDQAHKNGNFTGIGIGSVGPLDFAKGTIIRSANIPEISHCPVQAHAKQIAKKLGHDVEVALNNDASVTALSQHRFGLGKEYQNLATITLGTGVGGGLILNGELFNGFSGNAFEIGHTFCKSIPEAPLRKCGCGAHGCLETYASASAVSANYAEFAKTAPTISAKEVAQRARAKDVHAIRALGIAGISLGYACVNITHLLNLPLIILTGGLAGAHDVLQPYLEGVLKANLFDIFTDYVRIEFTEGDENYGIAGAAALVMP